MQGQLCLRSPRDKQGSTPAPERLERKESRLLSPRALEGTGAGSQDRDKKGSGGKALTRKRWGHLVQG